MCISTAYEKDEAGAVLAEYVTTISQRDGSIVMTDIMGREISIRGTLKSADLTRGVLVIEPD